MTFDEVAKLNCEATRSAQFVLPGSVPVLRVTDGHVDFDGATKVFGMLRGYFGLKDVP